ncbi:MAG: hypothetical protein IIC24_05600, partial [Chloroflexi bacterium]|nr:hypothetical protein [Chloroflexota bacterium]
MNVIKGLVLTFGAAMVMAASVACGDDSPPPPTDAPNTPSPPSSSAAPFPRPADVEELIAQSQIIVIGTIGEDFEEKMIGAYSTDGQPSGGREISFGVTDYQINIEEVIKGDETVSAGTESIVLRMFGRVSVQQSVVPSEGEFQTAGAWRPPAVRAGQKPGTYGSGPGGLIDIDSEDAVFADGMPFASGGTTAELLEQIKALVLKDATAPVKTLPPVPVMTLGYQNGVIEGTPVSVCWPVILAPDTDIVQFRCAEAEDLSNLSGEVSVQAGDTLTALIEANEPANEMDASIFTSDSLTMLYFDTLDANGTFTIPADLPSGVYLLNLFFRWDEGNTSYQFTLNVGSDGSYPEAPAATGKVPGYTATPLVTEQRDATAPVELVPVTEEFTVKFRYEAVAGQPLTVLLVADIVGGPDNSQELYCPGTQWQFGDGISMSSSASCMVWTPDVKINRRFEQIYTYDAPGTYK